MQPRVRRPISPNDGVQSPRQSPRSPLVEKQDIPSLSPGTIVDGKYRVVQRVAAGGMGEIYSVDTIPASPNDAPQRLALKIIKGNLDKETCIRFYREYEILSKYDHQNILKVYDCGTLADGAPYFTMELLSGRSLSEIASASLGKRLPWAHVVEMMIQVCDGLTEIHSNSIHRDLKPGNIFLTVDGKIKILDFGLALDSSNSDVSNESSEATDVDRLTSANITMGTTQYLAPEIFTPGVGGRAASVKSDMFALGVTMYKLLSGDFPFKGDTMAIFTAHASKQKPDSFDFECSDQTVKSQLTQIVGQLLQHNPSSRPDAASLKERLITLLPNRVDLSQGDSADPSTVGIIGASHFIELSASEELPPDASVVIPLSKPKSSSDKSPTKVIVDHSLVDNPKSTRPAFIVAGVVAAAIGIAVTVYRYKPEPDNHQSTPAIVADSAVSGAVTDASTQAISRFTAVGGGVDMFLAGLNGRRSLISTINPGSQFDYSFETTQRLLFRPRGRGLLINGRSSFSVTIDPSNPPSLQLLVTRPAPRAARQDASSSQVPEESIDENPSDENTQE